MPARPATTATAPITRPADEKITINLGCIDLGPIDLLVQEGFYANRSDLIRTAIRKQLDHHASTVREVASRRMLVLGIQHFTVEDLTALRDAGQMLDLRVLGLASFAEGVTPALALATIRSLTVLGAWHARPAVKAALASRTQ